MADVDTEVPRRCNFCNEECVGKDFIVIERWALFREGEPGNQSVFHNPSQPLGTVAAFLHRTCYQNYIEGLFVTLYAYKAEEDSDASE
jgi:hypothetical protein